MTHLLPPNLLKLFVPRPTFEHVPSLPADKDIVNRTTRQQRSRRPLDGVAPTLERVKQEAADKGEATEGAEGEQFTDAEYVRVELRREEKKKAFEEYYKRAQAEYDPQKDPKAEGDPFKTLFISRLAEETSESDLQKDFGVYGPIEHLRLIRGQDGKSRRYAFIVYEREKDMRTAYKDADGLKIHGKRILVDVERGRTVKDWKPVRLGGGLGVSQEAKKKKEAEELAAQQPMGFGMRGGRGGFGARGGFAPRGGFRGAPRGGGFGAPRGGYAPRGGFGPPAGRGGYGGPPSGGYQQSGPPSGGYGAPRGGYGGSSGGYGGSSGGYGGSSGGYGGGTGGYADGPAAKRGRY